MSPYNYAAENPVNAVDRDGREPATVTVTVGIIIGKALIGAGTDMATQIAVYMNQGYSFSDALAKVDYTSVVSSGAIAATTVPGVSTVGKFILTTGATAYNAFCDLNIEEGDKNVFNGRKSIFEASFDASTGVVGEALSSYAANYIRAGIKAEINGIAFSTFDPGQQEAIKTAYSFINNEAPEYFLNSTTNALVGTAKAEYENKNKSNSTKKQIQKLTPPQELIRGIELKNERQNILTPLSTNSVKRDYQYKKPKS